MPLNTGVLHHAPNISSSTKPSVKCYKIPTLQKLLHAAACDNGIVFFFLHLITLQLYKYKHHQRALQTK
jgi:hypothetical protein